MPNKTREDLIKEMQNKKEVARKRTIIVDNFYPALVSATVSVDEAKMLVSAMGSLMMEQVLETMKERKFSDIKSALHAKLCEGGERAEEVTALLNTLENENLYVAREIMEGVTRTIDQMILDEMRGRNLGTLKTKWEQYLK